jgi:hypothetical protein
MWQIFGTYWSPTVAINVYLSFEHARKVYRYFLFRSALLKKVLRVRIRIRIHRIQMFLGLPDPDPLVRGMDPDPDPALDPDPSIIMQK